MAALIFWPTDLIMIPFLHSSRTAYIRTGSKIIKSRNANNSHFHDLRQYRRAFLVFAHADRLAHGAVFVRDHHARNAEILLARPQLNRLALLNHGFPGDWTRGGRIAGDRPGHRYEKRRVGREG